ncbi:two-component system OmpR family response regulator [Promicromonospora sp. AC04]|nr:two-component system OmpR family response regulator [Promicromonospora sp. AC04]
MRRVRALLVEDEAKLARLVARGLTEHGHVADVVGSGEEALAVAADGAYDVVLLDVRLPGMDGFETCRRLRAARVWTPVVMLTARTAVVDRIAGLDAGADDYLAKPFAFDELLARMRAVARRGEVPRPTVLTVGDLRLDPASRRVWRAHREVTLSAREFALLEAFMRRPGRALTRDELLEHAWGWDSDVASNVVDVYVRYLREKVDRPYHERSIETVRGVGYRITAGHADGHTDDGANDHAAGRAQAAADGDG